MKNILLIIVSLVMFSCSKDENLIAANDITGEWKWIKKTGGIAGVNETPKEGETRILKLNTDNTYSRLENGKVISSGKYSLGRGKSMLFNEEYSTLSFDEMVPLMYEVKGISLYLFDDVYDGFNYEYVRVK